MLTEGTISFELEEETVVSLGIIVNLSSQSSFGIHAFKLEGVTVETLVPTEDPDGIKDIIESKDLKSFRDLNDLKGFNGVYDLSGRKVSDSGLKPGLYIKDGRKQVIK